MTKEEMTPLEKWDKAFKACFQARVVFDEALEVYIKARRVYSEAFDEYTASSTVAKISSPYV